MEAGVLEESPIPDSAAFESRLNDQVVGRRVVSELSASVHALLRHSEDDGVGGVVVRKFGNDDETSRLCWALEALFLHGLKAGLMTQLSRLLFSRSKLAGLAGVGGGGDAPTPCFWDLLLAVSHRDLVQEVSSLSQIRTDVGRCRAWIRLALNQNTLRSYLDAVAGDDRLLRLHYAPHAVLRDVDAPDIVSSYLRSIDRLRFEVGANSAILNQWNASPLVSSGWSEAPPTPAAPAIDVAAEPEAAADVPSAQTRGEEAAPGGGVGGRSKAKLVTNRRRVGSPSLAGGGVGGSAPAKMAVAPVYDRSRIDVGLEQQVAEQWAEAELRDAAAHISRGSAAGTSARHGPVSSTSLSTSTQSGPVEVPKHQQSRKLIDESYDDLVQGYSRSVGLHSIMGTPDYRDLMTPSFGGGGSGSGNGRGAERSTDAGSSSTTGSFVVHKPRGGAASVSASLSPPLSRGGGGRRCEDELSDLAMPVSASGSVSDGTRSRSSSCGSSRDDKAETLLLPPGPPPACAIVPSVCEGGPRDTEEGWEVVKEDYLGELGPVRLHREDEMTAEIECSPKYYMKRMGFICPEAGLDVENYQCKACRRPVGMIYGKARLCWMDGCYYCYECHEETTAGIPSRMVHNWDFAQYPVSKAAHDFLRDIHSRPVLDLKILNPLLYVAFPDVEAVRILRAQLSFIRMYLFSCRDPNIAQEFKSKLWPRDHLYEHVHLYSVFDLTQVYYGQLAPILKKAVAFGEQHIRQCELCRTKGFVCEICRNPQVIFPFESDKIYRCDQCRAVYHESCMTNGGPCRKCLRVEHKKETSMEG